MANKRRRAADSTPTTVEPPPIAALLGLLAFVLLAVLWFGVRPAFEDPATFDVEIIHRPAHGTAPRGVEFLGPWKAAAGGMVPAGPDARLRIDAGPGEWRRVDVELAGDVRAQWAVRVQRDHSRVTRLGYTAGTILTLDEDELPGVAEFGAPLTVELEPRGEPAGARVDRIRLRLGTESVKARGSIPALPGLLAGPLIPLLLAGFLFFAGRRSAGQAALLGAVLGTALAILAARQHQLLVALWAAAAAFAVGGSVGALLKWLRTRRTDPAGAVALLRAAEWLAVAALVLLALWTRWEQLLDARTLPLRPDAAGYRDIALHGSFYETAQAHAPWVREPLFPALLRIWFAIAPDTAFSCRFATILPALVLVVLTWLLGRAVASPVAGLIAAGFVALNPFMAGVSVEGLRDDVLAVLLLLALLVPRWLADAPWRRAVALGLLMAAMGLTRLNGLFLMVPILGWWAWRGRWNVGEIAAALALAFLPVLPHLAYNARIGDGDLLYSSSVHTRYYLNLINLGRDGYPADMAAWMADPYAGPVVGGLSLITTDPVGALVRIVRGYIDLYAWRFPHGMLFAGRELPMVAGLVGFWFLFRRRDFLETVAAHVLLMLPVALIAGIRLDYRLAVGVAPLLLVIWGEGVWQTAVAAWRVVAGWAGKRWQGWPFTPRPNQAA
jgi:hypothetical protein